jgi:hypothetical protein
MIGLDHVTRAAGGDTNVRGGQRGALRLYRDGGEWDDGKAEDRKRYPPRQHTPPPTRCIAPRYSKECKVDYPKQR